MRRARLEAVPGAPVVHNLDGLKKLIDEMPPGALESLEPEFRDVIDKIKSGTLDQVPPREMRRVMERASKLAYIDVANRQRLVSGGQSADSMEAERDAQERVQMNELAKHTASQLLTMTDEDWKAAGIAKPDFSKPLSYAKLVELDSILGKRGIKESDFAQHMTPAELEASEANDIAESASASAARAPKAQSGGVPKVSDIFEKTSKAYKMRVKEIARKQAEKVRDGLTLKPGDLAQALITLVKKQQHEQAISMFNEALIWEKKVVGFEPVDLVCINTIISVYAFLGDKTMALRTFELIDKYKYTPDVVTFNALIGLGAQTRDDRISLEMFKKMSEYGVTPDSTTYGSMILVYAQIGNAEHALKWFHEMRKNVTAPDSTPYAHLIQMYGIVLNDLPEAVKWIKQMITDEVPRNEYTAGIIADLHSKIAKEKQDKLRKEQEKPKTIQDQFILAYRNGDSKMVEKIWESMRYNRSHIPEVLWSTMLSYYNEHAKLELAAALFKDMEEAGVPPSRVTCNTMAQIYRRLGDVDKSQEMLQRTASAPRSESIFPGPEEAPQNFTTRPSTPSGKLR